MTFPFPRTLSVFADGNEIAAGCHLRLTGSESLSLRPGFFLLTAWDLSPSSAALLSGSCKLEVRSGISILAAGKVCDVHTYTQQGKTITEAGFSPGLSLWETSVSLSVSPGLRVSDTIREILAASGTGIQLIGFTGNDISLARSQAFFGRTASALETLADTADSFAWLSPAGLVISGKQEHAVTLILTDETLLSEPTSAESRMILSTAMLGWPAGAYVQYDWKGNTGTGRILSRSIDADNVSGPWKSELMIITGDE